MEFPKFADATNSIDDNEGYYPTEQQQIEALFEIEETYRQFFSTMKDAAVYAANKISPWEGNYKPAYAKWDSNDEVAIEGDEVVVTREYNDSCGCHPSYTTEDLRFPKELLVDRSKLDAYLKKLDDQKVAAAAAAEAAKKAKQEADVAAALAARKAQFENLKKEFGT